MCYNIFNARVKRQKGGGGVFLTKKGMTPYAPTDMEYFTFFIEKAKILWYTQCIQYHCRGDLYENRNVNGRFWILLQE